MVNYGEALGYIYSLTDYERLTRRPGSFNLDRISQLLKLLGEPQRDFPSFLVAGTKGKGSTAALIASALRSQGYMVGLYTQPHLHSYRERIQINGRPISKEDVVDGVLALAPLIDAMAREGMGPSTYEATTALAFRHFALSGVDVAVLEVGLGGRLDATNIVTPMVSVITPISLDHTEVLGETVGQIAWEKAGIIKEGGHVATAQTYPEALAVIKEVAASRHAKLTLVGREVSLLQRWLSFDHVRALGQTLTLGLSSALQPQGWPSRLTVEIPLLGIHQCTNAALAVGTLARASQAGMLHVTSGALIEGFRNVAWPARMEVLATAPTVVADGAHNRDSMRYLMLSLKEEFTYGRLHVVFGSSSDKDIAAMAEEIAAEADSVIATSSHHPRAASAGVIADHCKRAGLPVAVAKDVGEALDLAFTKAARDDLICVTGSLFLAAEARQIFGVPVEFD